MLVIVVAGLPSAKSPQGWHLAQLAAPGRGEIPIMGPGINTFMGLNYVQSPKLLATFANHRMFVLLQIVQVEAGKHMGIHQNWSCSDGEMFRMQLSKPSILWGHDTQAQRTRHSGWRVAPLYTGSYVLLRLIFRPYGAKCQDL